MALDSSIELTIDNEVLYSTFLMKLNGSDFYFY